MKRRKIFLFTGAVGVALYVLLNMVFSIDGVYDFFRQSGCVEVYRNLPMWLFSLGMMSALSGFLTKDNFASDAENKQPGKQYKVFTVVVAVLSAFALIVALWNGQYGLWIPTAMNVIVMSVIAVWLWLIGCNERMYNNSAVLRIVVVFLHLLAVSLYASNTALSKSKSDTLLIVR